MIQTTAVEFFSGIGSFAEACRESNLRILAAFDQNLLANAVYEHNFSLSPINYNLDSIQPAQIPQVDIWWMSPPCTPYSVRGRRADTDDPRARSLLRLIQLLPVKKPQFFFLENVAGFAASRARQLLLNVLAELNYAVEERQLCSTDFGVPMRRPRYFIAAALSSERILDLRATAPVAAEENCLNRLTLKQFLDDVPDERLIMPEVEFKKYENCLNVVDPENAEAVCICFTKGYYRCRLASGSLIRLADGRVRRFSSAEMLRLFGFSSRYSFPNRLSEASAAALLGNAVDVRVIRQLLGATDISSAWREPAQASAN